MQRQGFRVNPVNPRDLFRPIAIPAAGGGAEVEESAVVGERGPELVEHGEWRGHRVLHPRAERSLRRAALDLAPIPGFIADICMGGRQPKMQPKLVHGRDAIVQRS